MSDDDPPIFEQVGDDLRILHPHSQATIWQGRPDELAVRKVLSLPEEAAAVVLLDFDLNYPERRRNLVRIEADGEVAWRAALPSTDPTDAYVDVNLEHGTLSANSWSGYYVKLDTRTGEQLAKLFTK